MSKRFFRRIRQVITRYRLSTLFAWALLALALIAPATAQTLNAVKERGALLCGVYENLPGFSTKNANGKWEGFDIDFCRAVAAATFGDAEKVDFIGVDVEDRFPAVQSGKIDILSGGSTWTMAREGEFKLIFPATTYYDGQGFMVRRSMGLHSALELKGAKVCVQEGTTSERNAANFFRSNSMKVELVIGDDSAELLKAYERGICTALTDDKSLLYSHRLTLSKPSDHVILPDVISKEPRGPAVRQGDDQWALIVQWVHFAMLNAEELGVSSKNIDQALRSDNPAIRRLVGIEGNLGEKIGLSNDWVVRILRAVGNYGETFDRNIGTRSKLGIARGINNLWSQGGIQYGPPL
jgi:general L-amino acid transport system substrate-binding protein